MPFSSYLEGKGAKIKTIIDASFMHLDAPKFLISMHDFYHKIDGLLYN